jgi:hypothetical protein
LRCSWSTVAAAEARRALFSRRSSSVELIPVQKEM